MAHPGGRPRVLKSPSEAQRRGDAYFAACDSTSPPEPYLITGLALALGLVCRKQLEEYEARPEFTHIIKKLRLRVEAGYERRASGTVPAGAIFVLKNMGWSDRQEVEMSGGMSITDPGRSRLTDEQLAALIAAAEAGKAT